MDAKVIYWTAALANMSVLMFVAAAGVRAARRGAYLRHRRFMWIAIALVLAFLFSYPLKVAFLGRETLSSWEPVYVTTLRIHELCILVMTLAGGTAVVLAKRLGLPLAQPPTDARTRARVRLHRRMGWTAVLAGLLGVFTATVVLIGMYGRL